jgi:hypothetical protein
MKIILKTAYSQCEEYQMTRSGESTDGTTKPLILTPYNEVFAKISPV